MITTACSTEKRQLLAMTDPIAERSRKLGGDAVRSIGDIARHQRVTDCDQKGQTPRAMLAEILDDNRMLADNLRTAHIVCEQFGDVATASLIENWIDETDHHINGNSLQDSFASMCWFMPLMSLFLAWP
jgi:starvation-inducible DNA-binding protein